MTPRHAFFLLLSLAAASPAFAVLPGEMLSDPALEARARALSTELRCMVCQNQSIDDSDAPLAADLRVLIRERLKAGDSDAAIVDFLVARYGEFILLRPRFGWPTVALWAIPPAALIAAGISAWLAYRRRRESPPALSRDEELELKRILSQDE